MFIEGNSTPSEKLKAWYLFTDDFVAGTQHLSPLAVGIYVRLLCWNWNKKCRGIPDDAEILNRIAGTRSDIEQDTCGDVIKEFFVHIVDKDNIQNNKWQNARQLKEWLYINNRIANARVNGSKGGRPKNNPAKTPLPLTPTSTNNNIYMVDVFEKIWNQLKVKRGAKSKALKAYIKLYGKKDMPETDFIIEKFNAKCDSVSEKIFIPHFSTWLNEEMWTEELINESSKTQDDNFGLVPRDAFRNLYFWKKGRKMPQDIDSDIIIKFREDEIPLKAMIDMGFSESELK